MKRDLYTEEHWIDRDVYRKAAEAGVYALQIPEQYDGPVSSTTATG
jgi:alkylation response protein AidB-like acyl-CoA dehydrogenase